MWTGQNDGELSVYHRYMWKKKPQLNSIAWLGVFYILYTQTLTEPLSR